MGTKLVDETGMVTRPWADFFNAIYRYEKNLSNAETDGTYTLGLGSTDGEITISGGVITDIQEVVA